MLKFLGLGNDVTVRFHYKRKNDDYEGWNFWVWQKDKQGNDTKGTEVNFDEKASQHDSFGKVFTVKLKKVKKLRQIGFVIRKGDDDSEWAQKDVHIDRFIPVQKDAKELDVYVIGGEKDYFFNKEDAIKFLQPKEQSNVENETKEKIKVKIHYNRYNNDYDGWNLWVWPKDSLGFEEDGAQYSFDKQDEYGRYAEFEIEKGKNLTDLGIRINKNNWQEKDIDMNRYIPMDSINSDGEIEAYLLQYDEKIAYKKEEVNNGPQILKAAVTGQNRICAVLNYYPYDVTDFKVRDEEGELKVKYVNKIGDQRDNMYEIITEQDFSIGKKYTLLKGGYKASQVSFENSYDSKEFKEKYVYNGNDLGLEYKKEYSKFKVWAPTANSVKVCIYDKGIGGECLEEINMNPSLNGTWELKINRDLDGLYYTYKVDNYGKEREAVDIYAKAVGANGERGAIIDLETTNPKDWDKDVSPKLVNIEDSIIYEAHVRDLTIDENSGVKNKGKFLGLTEENTRSKEGERTGLSHLKELGITHLQLLPIFDFSGINERAEDESFNWGYNPENYNVPEGSYSTNASDPKARILECKEAIQALHKNNIRVIMDVVYNHTAKTEDSNFNKIVPGYYYRKNADGTFSNGSGCGNETSSEREMTKKMIIDSLKYWVNEYHVDGFRFDLMGLHDIDLMNEIREEMYKLKPNIVLHGEGWTAFGLSSLPKEKQSTRENARKLKGIATFNDVIRDAVKGGNSQDKEREAGFANGAFGKEDLIRASIVGSVYHPQINNAYAKVDEPIQTLNYVSAHDNLTLWDKIGLTNEGATEEDLKKIDKLSMAIVLTSQGIPFIHGGEEFLRTKQRVHNSYKSSNDINMFSWYRKTKYKDVNNYYERLIALRKEHPAFRMTTGDEIRKNLRFMDNIHMSNVIGYTIDNNANNDSYERVAVIFNANPNPVQITLPEGKWAVVLNAKNEEIRDLRCVPDNNQLWVDGITAIVLADAKSVEKELKRKEEIRKERKNRRRKERLEEEKRYQKERRDVQKFRRKFTLSRETPTSVEKILGES